MSLYLKHRYCSTTIGKQNYPTSKQIKKMIFQFEEYNQMELNI